MSIANPERSPRCRPPSMKTLIGIAISLGCCGGTAAPAAADPGPAGTDPNPFGTLSCSCRETAPPDSAALREEIARGIREGRSARLPGLPAPGQPTQPRP
jgi:hypothetical protein